MYTKINALQTLTASFLFVPFFTDCKCCPSCKAKIDKHTFILESMLEKLVNITDTFEIKPLDDNGTYDKMFIDELPLVTRDSLFAFENTLRRDPNVKHYLVRRFSSVGGSNERIVTSRILDMFVSPKCLRQMSWVGTAEKGSFRSLLQIIEVVNLSLARAFPNIGLSVSKLVESMLRSKLRNAEAKVLHDARKDIVHMVASGKFDTPQYPEY